jgi:hypothetical protein
MVEVLRIPATDCSVEWVICGGNDVSLVWPGRGYDYAQTNQADSWR